jgi:hypothetical protein
MKTKHFFIEDNSISVISFERTYLLLHFRRRIRMKKIVVSALILVIAALAFTMPFSLASVQTAATWNVQTVDSAGDVGGASSIALDSSNRPHISYYDDTYGDLMYARWTGSAWSIQTVDSAGDVGWDTSIALDSSNRPHISYYDATNRNLKYARWTGSAWSIQTVDSPGDVGWWTSIALDSSNNPHISYQANFYDYTNSALKYAKWTGSAWSVQTVDSTGSVGSYNSIALDSSNNPHISYYDGTNANLKYAKWTGSAWSKETVDSAGDVGRDTSIALDSTGNPHISYHYYTNRDLKYAYFGTSVLDTDLDFWFTPNPANPGQTVQLQGTLEDEHGSPVYPAQVKLEYSLNGGATWNFGLNLNTNPSGAFSLTFAAPAAGSYLFRISYAGSASYNPSTHTETLAVQLVKLDTKVQFAVSPNPATVGQTVTLMGLLSDISNNPIGGATVQIYARVGSGSWQLAGALSTNPSGYFQASGKVNSAGTYQIAVYYAGSSQYKSSYSIKTLTVNP